MNLCCCCSLRTGGIAIAIFQLIGWFASLVKYSYLLDTVINFQSNSSTLVEGLSNSTRYEPTETDRILLEYENQFGFHKTKWTIIYSFLVFVSLMAVVAAIMLLAGIWKKSVGLMKLCVFIQIVNILTLIGIATTKTLLARSWEMPVVEIIRILISLYFILVIGKLIEETKYNMNVRPKETYASPDPT